MNRTPKSQLPQLKQLIGPSFMVSAASVLLGLLAGIWTRDSRWAESGCVMLAPTLGFGIAWFITNCLN